MSTKVFVLLMNILAWTCVYTLDPSCNGQLSVAAFNIWRYGATKAGKPEVVQVLTQIAHRYDIVVLLGIQDKDGSAFHTLHTAINSNGFHYEARLSARHEGTSCAFLVRQGCGVELLATHQFNDTSTGIDFVRPPFSALFQVLRPGAGMELLALIAVHSPRNSRKAYIEAQALELVYQDVVDVWGTNNVMFLGDMSADCGSLSASALSTLTLRTDTRFHWLIDDEADTTVTTSDCAYSRLIVSGAELQNQFLGGATFGQVFYFDSELSLTPEQAEAISTSYPVEVTLNILCPTFSVAAFNVRHFGRSKMEDPSVVSILAHIIQRYDIILILEVRDVMETAIYALLNQANLMGPYVYNISISERLGKSHSKEQYAFLYRNNAGISILSTHQYVDLLDVLERPPYNILVGSTNTEIPLFVLSGLHVRPDNAQAEMNRLPDVVQFLETLWGIDNILILGDLNADCSYMSKAKLSKLPLLDANVYKWWIADDIDTTVTRTHCAYDRFIMTGGAFIKSVVPDSARPFRFEQIYNLNSTQALDVSDHYPIELMLQLKTADSEQSTEQRKSLLATLLDLWASTF